MGEKTIEKCALNKGYALIRRVCLTDQYGEALPFLAILLLLLLLLLLYMHVS